MTLFNIRPGIEPSPTNNSIIMNEAKLHGQLSALAASYVRLIKETVLTKLEIEHSYSIRDFQVLVTLSEASPTTTASDVFKSTGLDPATVTRSVKALIAHEHLTVSENDLDSRSRYLHLTNTGQALADEYKQACEEVFHSEAFSMPGLSNQEVLALQKTLRQLDQRVKILRLKNFS